MPKNASVAERWWEKVERLGPDDCWLWKAARDKNGYGKFQEPLGGSQVHVRAHRWGYAHFVGSISDGLVVCHRCDNPPCVNPAHLFLGTARENNDDKVAKGRHARVWGFPLAVQQRDCCKRGHPWEGDNLAITTTGSRRCRTCAALRARVSYRQKHGLPGSGQPRPKREVAKGARKA